MPSLTRGAQGLGPGLCIGLRSGDTGLFSEGALGTSWIIPVLDTGQSRGQDWCGSGLVQLTEGESGGMAICQTSHQPLPRLPCASPASGRWYIKDPHTPKSPSPSSVLYPAAQISVALEQRAAVSQSRAVYTVFWLTGPGLSSSPWQSHHAPLGSQLSHSQCEPPPLTSLGTHSSSS